MAKETDRDHPKPVERSSPASRRAEQAIDAIRALAKKTRGMTTAEILRARDEGRR